MIKILTTFFHICPVKFLKMTIKGPECFLKMLKWCGRIIDGVGGVFNPRNLSGLKNIHLLSQAPEFCE